MDYPLFSSLLNPTRPTRPNPIRSMVVGSGMGLTDSSEESPPFNLEFGEIIYIVMLYGNIIPGRPIKITPII